MKLFMIISVASLLIAATQARTFLEEENDETGTIAKCMSQMKTMGPRLEQCRRYGIMHVSIEKYGEAPLISFRDHGCKDVVSCLNECCMVLKEVDEECVCGWMDVTVGEGKEGMAKEFLKLAMEDLKHLPSACGLSHGFTCHRTIAY